MVIKMRESGFCAGVHFAVKTANEQQAFISDDQKVYLYGDIVNNDYVIRDFREKGFEKIDDIEMILPNSIVIIRAHGVAKHIYEKLLLKNVIIKDCTCKKVLKIHEIAEQKSKNGYKIIIVGKKGHPEVDGTFGWCLNNSVSVAEKLSDLDTIDLSEKLCVVAQTTCKRRLWEQITQKILEKNPNAEIENTLCETTGLREQKAEEISKTVDLMIVIGGKNSSNSQELFDICKSSCKNTFFIESLEELDKDNAAKKAVAAAKNIGVAGSASTSDEVIEDVYDYLSFLDFLGKTKDEIEKASDENFEKLLAESKENPFITDVLNLLAFQNAGGKKIRGAMIKLGENIASLGEKNNYLPLAVGYELFQTSILIHDDIIDKSEMRRNKPTIHVSAADKIKNENGLSDENAVHFGISKAICIGDYGFFAAYRLFSQCDIDSSVLINVFKLCSEIFLKTCEGELMDVMLPFEKFSAETDYELYCELVTKTFEYKTAWYTLAGPVMLGAVCGGGNDELLELLKNITIPLGIAFQIKDDLLGIYSDEDSLGKSIFSDIIEKKQTLLYGYAVKHANENEKFLLNKHYGNENANNEDLSIIRNIFRNTGAKKYAENEIKRLSDISKNLIKNSDINNEYKNLLNGLISYLTIRKF